jgi:hypothetical protein
MMLHEVLLPNGTKVMVDKRTAAQIEALRDLQLELGAGIVSNLFVARTLMDADKPESLLAYNEPSKLSALSQTLSTFSRKCQEQASVWEGNAPNTNRSFGVQ